MNEIAKGEAYTEVGPRIYVACLAAYNNGILHGEWIEVGQDSDDVWKGIRAILKASPIPNAEEWAIHDYEGFFDYRVSEYHNIDELCEVAQAIDEEDDPELLFAVIDHLGTGTSIEDGKKFLEENYHGAHKDLEDYAYNFCQDCYSMNEVPEMFQRYIDYQAMGRDWEYSGDIFTIELRHEIHVFSNA